MTSTLPPLVQAISGAIGSASANALTYPIDLATTRLQLQSPKARSTNVGGIEGGVEILRRAAAKHGISALYDGIASDTMATMLSNFFYFYCYSFLRTQLQQRLKHTGPAKSSATMKLSLPQELMLGWIAGVASRAISTPLNLVTLRLQTENEHQAEEKQESERSSIMSVIQDIYSEEGLPGFWRGFRTSVLLSLNPSITMSFFQLFRRALLISRLRSSSPSPSNVLPNPSPRDAFVGGAISNSIAVALLYPLILAKTRLQAAKLSSSNSNHASLTSVLVEATLRPGTDGKHAAGLAGLYQGLEMQIVKGFLSQGVTFLVKGRIEQLVVDAYVKRLRRQNI